MGCKSAAKSNLKEETVASSSSSLSSLSRYNQTIQSSAKRKTIQEQGVEHGSKSNLGDEEESEESNTAARTSSRKSFSLRESGTSGIADSSVTR